MTQYEIGNTVVWGLEVRDAAGALADLGGGNPTATVTLPDSTTAAATIAKTSTGKYTASYVAAQAGRHRVTWAGSGTNSAGLPFTDHADVYDFARMLISLADARASLNLPASTTVDDADLRAYVLATTEVIESYTGPLLPTTLGFTLDGNDATEGGTALTLPVYPTAITSVVEGSTTLAATLYSLGRGGVLRRTTGAWAAGWGNIVVTVTVGSNTALHPNVVLAAREQLRHLWQVGQIAGRPILGDTAAGVSYVPQGFAVPNRVIELLAGAIGSHQSLGVH